MALTYDAEAESQDVFYLESSMPADLTIADYRRCRPQRASLWRRFRRRLI
jgi:hypothetical protein